MNEGTYAKEIVGKFFEATKMTPSNYPRHMAQAKRLLKTYTHEQILYAVDRYGSEMYSLGYLNEERMYVAISKLEQSLQVSTKSLQRGESIESIAERNQRKLQGVHYKSRFRENDFVDLFE